MKMNQNNYKKTIYNTPFIEHRADPYICKHIDGRYYFTASVPEYDRIILRTGKTLDELREAEEVTVWNKHEKGQMSIHIWAPELHYLDGKWYIYFAAGEVEDIWKIRPYVLECTGQDPMEGKWIERGMLEAADPYTFQDFSLDMTVFENHNKKYVVWAEKISVGQKISNLYIAEMETPTKLKSKQALLTAPDYEWERVDFWVNEGPAMLKHNGRNFLMYSASATGACYCMGMLSIDEDQDPLDPRVWKKERNPVLCTDEGAGLYGPGHNSFVKGEDDEMEIMIYHARTYDEIIGDPLYDANRHAYRMKIDWDEQGCPIFDYNNNY